ncbi:MAG: signal peptide peptidase SppA [Planctomycetota bacterium]|nr:signal peptide peptidase SppA [Planctomycetales bacterium]RLT06901.1 MAG: signal peptide peptidase SppA [Planctomycetota bacterium]
MTTPPRSSVSDVPETDARQIIIHCTAATIRARASPWFQRVFRGLLVVSLLLNVWYIWQPFAYHRPGIPEQHLLGIAGASDRIAVINFEGTISPPFTSRWLRELKQAQDDASVRGVLLVIDSPGGFVADSHQLYREIQKLAKAKPVNVAMKRIAASGGYYIAMGIGEQGRIYVEPTTWTGSIGVIIPRYNATELVEKFGIKSEPLVTGPLKDTLNPFRDMTEQEKSVWGAIMEDAFSRFVGVIADNRTQLDAAAVRLLATGQIYTANQAIEKHLVDQIGYVEDAVADMARSLNLSSYDAFEYRSTPGLIDLVLGVETGEPKTISDQILQASVPQAMYYASWNPWIP